jgi:hypothetical protein
MGQDRDIEGTCRVAGCKNERTIRELCDEHYDLHAGRQHWTDEIIDDAVSSGKYKKPKPGTLAKLVDDRRPEKVSRHQPADYDEKELLEQLPPAFDASEGEEITLEDLKRMHGDD